MVNKKKPSNEIKLLSSLLLNNKEQGKYYYIRKKDPLKYLNHLRLTIPPDFYNDAIIEIERYPYSGINFVGPNRKKTLHEFESKALIYVSFESEFSWAKNILIRNISLINRFLFLSNEYSSELLKGNIKHASQLLNEIENETGLSLWLIKNKIAFLQITEGLEAQKKYANIIKSKLKNGSLSKFIVHWTSIRNENQTTVGRFSSQIDSIINKLSPIKQLGFKEYIKYHLLGHDTLDPDDFIQVLRLEYSCSIIDYYEAFVSLLRVLVVNDTDKYLAKVYNLLKNVKYDFKDNRVYFLKKIINIDVPTSYDCSIIECHKLFLKGFYYEAFLQSQEKLLNNPDNAILLMINAYSKALSNNKNLEVNHNSDDFSFKYYIISNLSKIIDKGLVSSSKEYNELKKIALNFSYFPWALIIDLIQYKESSIYSRDNICNLLALKMSFIHPSIIECFENERILYIYKKLCSELYGHNIVNEYYSSLKELKEFVEINELSFNHNSFLKGLIYYYNGNYNEAIISGLDLKKQESGYFIRRGYGLISRSYLKINDFKNACKCIADCYINEKHFYPFLPLKEILEIIKLGSEEWNLVNSDIDFSIIIDACVKHVDNKYEMERRFAYEDFLLKNGVNKPSLLSLEHNKFDISKLIYYLRYICLETIMDTSEAFENGSQELVVERLAICRMLIEIDPQNEDVYKLEIKDLVRRQVISKRRTEVDQSRIYVDINSIKESAESELKENYDRYITYLKTGLNALDIDKSSKPFSNIGINIPENEVNALLKYMIEEIRDIYLSPEFGLDRFISTRIRHGDLERNLRSPVQKQNLITKKGTQNGPYLRNEFWLNKLYSNSSSNNTIKNIDRAFLEFAESYDNMIFIIKNEWLQIKQINKPKGLFDFTINDAVAKEFASQINDKTTLAEFIDKVIQMLDNFLIINLVNVRHELNEKAKIQAKNLLNKLHESTYSSSNTVSLELQSAINKARTDIQIQFDKVIEWFVPSSSGNSTPYIIEDAMAVAEAIIKEENPLFRINIDADEDSSISIHGHLPIFVDIFVNIFENIVKRSGLAYPEANIILRVNNIKDNLITIHFKVVNELSSDIDLGILNSDLNRKKNLLQSGSYSQFLSTEGNSGLFKIHKSVMDFHLFEDERIKPTMDFGIENNIFQISISVPFRMFVLDLENNQ